jgi:hypothetical protein
MKGLPLELEVTSLKSLKAEQNVSFTHWIPGKMQEMIKWDGMNL